MDCNLCPKKNCLKLCKPIKRWLKRQGIKSAEWIRPRISPRRRKKEKDNKGKWREIPFSALSDIDIDKNKYLS